MREPRAGRRVPRLARRALAFVSACALVAGLGACSALPNFLVPSQPRNTSQPVKEKVSPDLRPYYTQVLHWASCGEKMQCTKAKAPLDWAHPSEGSISLALVRHLATGEREGSLLVNPGGPGGSGYDFVKDSLDYATDKSLQSRFDIVGFDPRGVGRSTAVHCYGPSGMDDYLYAVSDLARGSEAWIAQQTGIARGFADACKENTGALLAHVGTVSAARDLDLLRAILGDTKLHYLGYSYGTYLGATYAGLYPKKVGRLVLDGAIDPAASNFQVTLAQSEGFEKSLRAYLKHCLSGKRCPFSGGVDHAMDRIAALLKSVQAHPLRNHDGRELGADTLITAIIYPLYDASAWGYLTEMFRSVLKGDPSEAFVLADGYNDRSADGTYSDNSTEAFMAVNCLDYSYDDSPAAMKEQAEKLRAAAPVIGPYMAYGDIGCAVWPYHSSTKRGPIHAAGAAPILVVGTTGDPATPYQWAKNLAGELDSGHLVTYRGEGHTAYNKSNSCVNDAVDDYLIDGRVPPHDPRC